MTKKKPKDKRVEDIILAAVDEFLEKGYESSSMEAIASRAGISKGGLYHHFNSKDEILMLANSELSNPINYMMKKAQKKPTASQALGYYIRIYLEFWSKHKKEYVFYLLSASKMLGSPALWQMYENYMKKVINFFQELYQKGIDSGEFISHPTYENALILMSALDGVSGYLIISKDIETKKVFNIFQKNFINPLKKVVTQKNGGENNGKKSQS